jgi:hypothetical protein
MPKPLDLGRLGKFEPSRQTEERPQTTAHIEDVDARQNRWPSREPVADGQISIKGPLKTIRRFQALCKDDRRTYADMLNILMDAFEKKA